jgi:hypothetical protein
LSNTDAEQEYAAFFLKVEECKVRNCQIVRKVVTETQGDAYEVEPDPTNGNGKVSKEKLSL